MPGHERDGGAVESDASVIGRSLDDPDAFAEIFERHHPAIWSFAVSRLGREDGADVAAQVFVTAFEQRDRFDPDYESARPWLFGIAANLVRRAHRTRRRGSRALVRLAGRLGGRGEDAVLEVDDRLAAEGRLAEVKRCLDALSRRDREILLMAVMDGLSYREVAEALGIPIGTVRSRLSRSRRRLAELVGPSGQQEGEGAERA